MSAIILRFLIYAALAIAIYVGVRKIWSDWTRQFRSEEKQVRERDLQERKPADVIDLKRGGDGIFRPGSGRDGDDTRRD